jgi:hypothetical protein
MPLPFQSDRVSESLSLALMMKVSSRTRTSALAPRRASHGGEVGRISSYSE